MTTARDQVSAEADSDIPDLTSKGWDLLVVGGGTAGIVGAKTAASFGARVLLVERERTGGDCLWTECVPSKSLLAAAAAAADARTAARFSVHAGDVRVDFAQVMAHVRSAIAAIAPTDSVEALEAAAVHVLTGNLTFTGPTAPTLPTLAIEVSRSPRLWSPPARRRPSHLSAASPQPGH